MKMFDELMEKAQEYKNAYEGENNAIREEEAALELAIKRAEEAKHKAIAAGDREAYKAACEDLAYCNGRKKLLNGKKADIVPADEFNAFIDELKKARNAANAKVYKRMREAVELWKGCLDDLTRNDAQASAAERTMRGALPADMHMRPDRHKYHTLSVGLTHVFKGALSVEALSELLRKVGGGVSV